MFDCMCYRSIRNTFILCEVVNIYLHVINGELLSDFFPVAYSQILDSKIVSRETIETLQGIFMKELGW